MRHTNDFLAVDARVGTKTFYLSTQLHLRLHTHLFTMSSSSATATTSRSPSPATPDSSDSPHNPISVQNNDVDLWYDHGPSPNDNNWEKDGYMKDEEQPILQFDDLIQEHAYEE